MRLDTLNIGVSENIDENHGCLTVIASGQFDSANAVRVLREQHAATRSVNRVQVFEPDGESTMIFPSDQEFVMMVAPNGEQAPVEGMAATLNGGADAAKVVGDDSLRGVDAPARRPAFPRSLGRDQGDERISEVLRSGWV